MLERIWNGWRADYVVHGQGAQKKSDQSVFTQILNGDMSDEQCYIVHRGEKVFAIMNAFPYTSGHLLVVPYREVAELEDLTQDETSELWATVTDGKGLEVGVQTRSNECRYQPWCSRGWQYRATFARAHRGSMGWRHKFHGHDGKHKNFA